MIKKKLGNVIVAGLLALAVIQTGATAVKAGDAYNFDFCFDYDGDCKTTDQVVKNNESYASMQCTDAEIAGTTYSARVFSGTGACCSEPYYFTEGVWQLLANSVAESGYDSAYIQGQLVDSVGYNTAIFWGYWYADSDIY